MRYLVLTLFLFLIGCSVDPVVFDCSKKTDEMTDEELDYCSDYLSHRQRKIWLIEQSRKGL